MLGDRRVAAPDRRRAGGGRVDGRVDAVGRRRRAAARRSVGASVGGPGPGRATNHHRATDQEERGGDTEGREAAKRADDERAGIRARASGAGAHGPDRLWAGGSTSGRGGAQARHLPRVSSRRLAGAELALAAPHVRYARGALRGEPVAAAGVARPLDHQHDDALRAPRRGTPPTDPRRDPRGRKRRRRSRLAHRRDARRAH